MTRKPWEPTPMKATLTLSLGGTYFAPPSTRRGTIEKPIAAAVVCPRNLRREIKLPGKLRDRRRFFTVPPAAPLPTVNEPGICLRENSLFLDSRLIAGG